MARLAAPSHDWRGGIAGVISMSRIDKYMKEAACKAVYAGLIPIPASNMMPLTSSVRGFFMPYSQGA